MNLQLKNSLILTGTLVLGIIIGVLVSGRIMQSKVTNYKNFYTEQGFNRQIMRVIKPTDKQKELLKPIFLNQARKNQSLFKECQQRHHELMEGFRAELKNYLTSEQMQRLDHMEKRMRNRNEFHPHGSGNGPGPHNRMPANRP